jgi:hypothetical protein
VHLEVLGRRWLALARNESVSNLTSTLLGVRERIDDHQQENKILTRLNIDGEVLPAGCADGLRDDLARLFGACGCVSVREGPETNVPVCPGSPRCLFTGTNEVTAGTELVLLEFL